MTRVLLMAALLLAAAAAPLQGQEVPVRPAQGGVLLTFQDADLGFVIAALAQAAGLNVVYTDLPAKPVTLRTQTPVPLAALADLIRSLAAANGITVIEDGSFLQLRGGGEDTQPPDDRRLYIHRLRHARATVLAETLQQLFGGGGVTTTNPQRTQALSAQIRNLQQQGVNVRVPQEALRAAGLGGALEGDVLIVPDETTNSLLVRATPADWQVMQEALMELDLRPLQVLIEVVIAEVRRTDNLNVGVSISAEDADGTRGELTDETTPDNFTIRFARTGSVDVEATLAALAASGNVRILSRPVIQAQNNQEARILVGSRRPFVAFQLSTPGGGPVAQQAVQYLDVGTALTITPTINPEGYVNLTLIQEVSGATNETQFDAPVISTREAETQLLARNGQTVVIGGLVDHQEDRSRSGVPFLKDIPVLGFLFGTTRHADASSELFLFLTPHIVESDEDADRLKREIEANARLLEPLTPILPLIPPALLPDTMRLRIPPPDTMRPPPPDTAVTAVVRREGE